MPVTGTPGSLTFGFQETSTGPSETNPSITVTDTTTFQFNGALNGNVINGTLTFTQHEVGPFSSGDASGSAQITLQ